MSKVDFEAMAQQAIERKNAEAAQQESLRAQRLADLESGDVPAQLAMWPEPIRRLPDALMRSAMFSVVKARKRKQFADYTLIASTKDAEVYYKGEELTQFDLTVWMQDLHLARLLPGLHGTRISYAPNAFLKEIGVKSRSKAEYLQLWESQLRLQDASLRVDAPSFYYAGSLIAEVHQAREAEADHKGRVVLSLPPSIVEMFGADGGWHYWQYRLSVNRDPLAQRLMALWSTFAAPAPYTTALLYSLAGLSCQHTRNRRARLKRACEKLVEIGFLDGYEFDLKRDTLSVQRVKLRLSDVPHGLPTKTHPVG